MSACGIFGTFLAGCDLGRSFWPGLNIASGATLGAAFYVLLRTQPYLLNRSYDPKYNSAYLCRFVTGLTAGVILASGVSGWLYGHDLSDQLTPGVLAILGGYSAEAVEQILQRLVEILLAVVRGDGSLEAQAKAATENVQRTARVHELLTDIETAHAAAVPPEVATALKKIRDELRKKP